MKLEDIIKTKAALDDLKYGVENNVIEKIDINVIAHFGNTVSLEIVCSNIVPYSAYNNTGNIGRLIRALIKLFELEQEDGIRLSSIKQIPCRLVFGTNSDGHWGERAIGIGHFMKDKFVLFSEFSMIDQ